MSCLHPSPISGLCSCSLLILSHVQPPPPVGFLQGLSKVCLLSPLLHLGRQDTALGAQLGVVLFRHNKGFPTIIRHHPQVRRLTKCPGDFK